MDSIWSALEQKTPDDPQRPRTRLSVGRTSDAAEAEADRAADRVLTDEQVPSASPVSAPASGAEAPDSVDCALATSGAPLDAALQHDMEQRFGHDFSRVRVHTGPAADRSANDIDAAAYTVGHDIVFGRGQFAPAAGAGRRLLSHELAHVVQQSGSPSAAAIQRAPKPAKKKKPATPQICGRDSKKVAGNSITKVKIDVGAHTLEIEWQDPSKAPAGSAGTHRISPGTGKCCVDCNDDTVSQTGGSLCTPKGGSWPVDRTACALGGHPSAKNPTYFQRGGIAIHSGNTSAPPQSHGCARTSTDISALIHDNVIKDVTQIESSGTWSSSKCYLTESTDTLSNRADVCDGNKLKPKPKPKSKPKGARAAADASDVERPLVEVMDGPGPNNAGAVDEGIEVVPDAIAEELEHSEERPA